MRFTFVIVDSKGPRLEPVAVDLPDALRARAEAITVLTGLAKDSLPDGNLRDFIVEVRGEDGVALFEASLSFRSRWLDGREP